MSVKDVRDFLLKQLAELADSDMTADEAKLAIEKAKATSQTAGTYIAAVRVELDAVKLFDETGMLPGAIDTPEAIERPQPKVLSFDQRKRAA